MRTYSAPEAGSSWCPRHNGDMALFSRRPDPTHDAIVAALGRVHVLAAGTGEGDLVLGATASQLVMRRGGHWQTWGWEEIAKGAWREDSSRFTWTDTAGCSEEVILDEVGRLPEVFRDRVQASTLLSEVHDLPRGRVEIVGRRALDGSDRTRWYASASGGASLTDPSTAAQVVAWTDALKAQVQRS